MLLNSCSSCLPHAGGYGCASPVPSTQFLTCKLSKIMIVTEQNKQKGFVDGFISLTVSEFTSFILFLLEIVSQLHQSHWKGRLHPSDSHLPYHHQAWWSLEEARTLPVGRALEWVWSFSRAAGSWCLGGWRVMIKAW